MTSKNTPRSSLTRFPDAASYLHKSLSRSAVRRGAAAQLHDTNAAGFVLCVQTSGNPSMQVVLSAQPFWRALRTQTVHKHAHRSGCLFTGSAA